MILIDTSGIFGLIDADDPSHSLVQHVISDLAASRQTLLITDHVVSETYTLLNARKRRHLAGRLQDIVHRATHLELQWTDRILFEKAERYFLQHADKDYSFTDCLSFVVMHEHRITQALTTDHHFTQAGFRALLIPS